jgi:hypothetical protein
MKVQKNGKEERRKRNQILLTDNATSNEKIKPVLRLGYREQGNC